MNFWAIPGELMPRRTVDAPDVAKRFGQRLREARGNITQKQLSKASGVAQATISRIEKGEENPSLGICEALIRGLGRRMIVVFATPDHIAALEEIVALMKVD